MPAERIKYVDAAKGIGIILVVVGHILNQHSLPCLWLREFHMPLFFFLSGFCYNPEKYNKFSTFAKRRLTTIGIPILCFAMISLFLEYTFLPEYYSIGRISQNLPGAMWFLPVLFLSEILFYGIYKISSNRIWLMSVLITLMLLGVFLDRFNLSTVHSIISIPIATFFYGIGNMMRVCNERIEKIPGYFACLLVIPLLIVFVFDDSFDLVSNHIAQPFILHIFAALVGIVAVISVSLKIKKYRINDTIIYLGRNSLIILCMHTIAIYATKIYIAPYVHNHILFLALQFILIWLVCIVCIELINNYCPIIVGKNNK